MQNDLNIYVLEKRNPARLRTGSTARRCAAALEKFIIADDVQVVDVAPHYGLLSVHGPKAVEALTASGIPKNRPATHP